jgi:hypothetical protein
MEMDLICQVLTRINANLFGLRNQGERYEKEKRADNSAAAAPT